MLFTQASTFPQVAMGTGVGTELPFILPMNASMWDDFDSGIPSSATNAAIFKYDMQSAQSWGAPNATASSVSFATGASCGQCTVATRLTGAASGDEAMMRSRAQFLLVAGKPMSVFGKITCPAAWTATHWQAFGLFSVNNTTPATGGIATGVGCGIGFRTNNQTLQIGVANDTVSIPFATAVTGLTAGQALHLGLITDGVKHQFYLDNQKIGELTLDCTKATGAPTNGNFQLAVSCGTTTTATSRVGIDYWGFSALR